MYSAVGCWSCDVWFGWGCRVTSHRIASQRTLFDLLGPIIDPIGYQIELETYVANIMRGPANLYITLVGYLGSALVFFHFFVDPQQALTVRYYI